MNFSDYQVKSYVNIQPHTDDKDTVLNWLTGLNEEVGEVNNVIKHHYWGNENINKENLAKEIGDVLWYLSALCSSFNISLDTIALLNIEKLKYRYKDSFTNEKSKLRKENEQKFSETDLYKQLIKNL